MTTARKFNQGKSRRAVVREAAEALFNPKRRPAPKETLAAIERRPRTWRVTKVEPAPKIIHPSDEARVRTWTTYGLTRSQAAAIFDVPASEIDRVRRKVRRQQTTERTKQ